MIPSDLRFHKEHEWVRLDGKRATVGISDFAQDALGDIVFLDLKNLNYVPLNSAINQVVNAEDATGVDSVMIGGRMVLDRGRLTTIDVDRLVARAEAAMDRVWDTNGRALELALKLEEVIGTFCVGLAQSPYHVHRYCE